MRFRACATSSCRRPGSATWTPRRSMTSIICATSVPLWNTSSTPVVAEHVLALRGSYAGGRRRDVLRPHVDDAAHDCARCRGSRGRASSSGAAGCSGPRFVPHRSSRMSASLSVTGGLRVGWLHAELAARQAHRDGALPSVSALILGGYEFTPDQVVALEPHGVIPVVGRGIRVVHRAPTTRGTSSSGGAEVPSGSSRASSARPASCRGRRARRRPRCGTGRRSACAPSWPPS